MDKYISLKDCLKQLNKDKYSLPIILGKDSNNDIHIKDLKDLKNILISGSTSSGKSVFLNSFINTILLTKSPKEVQFIIIDSKMFGIQMYKLLIYRGVEHLLVPVITDMKEVGEMLSWCTSEIEKRKKSNTTKPTIIIVIDEFSDIMLNSPVFAKGLEDIVNEGSKVGIYTIISTSSPRDTVITDTLQKYIKVRIVGALPSSADSTTVLGEQGAEDLLGSGDMIFKNMDTNEKIRVQAPFISTEETEKIVKEFKKVNPKVNKMYDEKDLEHIEKQKEKDIKNILKTFKKFKIPLTLLNTTVGPTAIKYEFLPENQKDIKTFVSLRFYIFSDLKQYYVTEPFPWMYVSKSKESGEVITVETSNWLRKLTMLKDCLPELEKRKYYYPVILGKDFNNEILIKELKELENILIVGWGMSGSSSFILSLLFTLLNKHSEEEFKLVIVSQMDLKHHNLSFLPHLFYDKVAIDSKESIEALKKCVEELERREKNKVYGPPLLIVVEEFSDLFLTYKEFRKLVYILLERGNRVGIHLIFSTANRFANTITPKFKKYFNTRITFATSNEQSIRVLEQEGGEYLDNRMDMLYKDMNSGELQRLQAPYIFNDDISLLEKLAKNPPEKIDIMKLRDEEYYTKEITPERDPLIEEAQDIVRVNKKCTPSLLQRKLKIGYNRAARLVEELKGENIILDDDSLYEDAKKIVVEERKASASLLQRRLIIGYNRAVRLMERLEENGIVSPQIGVKPREVLINEIKKEK